MKELKKTTEEFWIFTQYLAWSYLSFRKFALLSAIKKKWIEEIEEIEYKC